MKKYIFRNDLERGEWLRHLGSLLEEGYSMGEALKLLGAYQPGAARDWSLRVYDALQAGEYFAEQLSDAGFTNDVISYLYFAERTGDFSSALNNGSLLLKKKHDIRQKGRKLLQYPLFLFTGLLVMAGALSEGVFPHFQSYFASSGQPLPWITSAVISLTVFFQLPFLISFLTVILLALIWLKKKPALERMQMLVKIPYISNLTRSLLTYYFISQLAPLLKSGFSMKSSLETIKKDAPILFFRQEAESVTFDLLEGISFSECISSRRHFEPQLSAVISLGEAKGKVGEELERYGNYLFNTHYEKMERFITVLQPVLFSLIGVVVLILFLSMMLPVFSIVDGW